jgi:hypothetical protein
MSATNNQPELDAKIQEVRSRLQTDEAFRAQAVADLASTLRAAGVPADAMDRYRVVREGDEDPSTEVSGHTMMRLQKEWWECYYTSGGSKVCVRIM